MAFEVGLTTTDGKTICAHCDKLIMDLAVVLSIPRQGETGVWDKKLLHRRCAGTIETAIRKMRGKE